LGDIQCRYSKAILLKCLKHLQNVLIGIIDYPEPKPKDIQPENIRSIKRGSPSWTENILAFDMAEKILIEAGFSINEEENLLVLASDDLDLVRLKQVAELVHEALVDCSSIYYRGVTLDVLESVLSLYEGGRKLLKAPWDEKRVLSPGESLVQSVVIPATKRRVCSYVETLTKDVGPVNVFVSHAWKYPFKLLVGAISSWEKGLNDKRTRFYFIDYLAVNQNVVGDKFLALDELQELEQLVRSASEFVLVLSPYKSPIPLTRAWCCLEIATAINSNVSVSIVMPEEQNKAFIRALVAGECVFKFFDKINSALAEASKSKDLINISKKIVEMGGFSLLDNTIISFMREWYLDVIKKVDRKWAEYSEIGNRCEFLIEMGWFLNEFDKHIEALSCFDKAMHVKANDPQSVFRAFDGIARTLVSLDRNEDALEIYMKAIPLSAMRLGENHVMTLVLKDGLASLYHNLGMLDEALKLLQEVHTTTIKHNNKSVKRLHALQSVAIVLIDMHRYQEALENQREVVELSIELRGRTDPGTLKAANRLAEIYAKLGNVEKAKDLSREWLALSEKTLGPNNLSTLILKSNFGKFLGPEEGLKLHQECLAGMLQIFDPNHKEVLILKGNIAYLLAIMGKYEAALKIEQQVLNTSIQTRGPDHFSTLDTKYNMACTLLDLGRTDEAVRCFREVIRSTIRIFGPNHPIAIRRKFTLLANLILLKLGLRGYHHFDL